MLLERERLQHKWYLVTESVNARFGQGRTRAAVLNAFNRHKKECEAANKPADGGGLALLVCGEELPRDP